MTVWWVDEGVGHSERILAEDLRYLSEGLEAGVSRMPPAALARHAAALARRATDAIGIPKFIRWFREPSESFNGPRGAIRNALVGLDDYFAALVNVVQTFAVRVTVLALATPAFTLFGMIGFAEGLMRRDLRRWGGGRESSFVYHHSKRILSSSVLSAWMLYLVAPVSLHPSFVLVPFAMIFGLGLAVTTATFKKYL
jgi:integrating conjugative element membrane protein (TIGR03747 family)